MTIIELKGAVAVAETGGVKTEVNTALASDIKKGDKVLVHAGFIIEKLDPAAAKEIEEAWEAYSTAMEKSD
jgi:hydrogenase expression/formation protein HypC